MARLSAVACRAVRFRAPRGLAIEPVEVRPPGRGEVRVRLEGCGVCGSNLPAWEGRPWFSYPLSPGAPGHEGWGTIDAVGEGVGALARGDRVALLSYNAYAEYDIAPAAGVVRLPATLAGRAFPGEPLVCVVNIFRRSAIEAGQTVAIVGIGFIGAALTALAARAGARVIALSRRGFALEMAERMGAAALVPLEDAARAVAKAKAITGESGCHCVIEAVGSQQALDVATELTGVRGRLVIAGYHQDGLRQVNLQQWNWRGLDVINAHERDPRIYRRGMEEAIELVARGDFDPDPLWTHRFPLEEAGAAFEALALRPAGFLKALIVTGAAR
ncbi:MAG TPA: zinc-binding dehydrogenase [Steroidobacteraceae bacterium]|nr:zinc-binding dehydrogenase [Steroidobacteraceae bacterium]